MDSKQLRATLAGAKLVRLDEQTVEHFSFLAEGNHVAAILGTRDGPVCAPIFRYNVTDDGKVEILDGDKPLFTWECIELSDGILTARCQQRVHRYTFTKVTLPPKLTFRDWMAKHDNAA
jgi:hypothetical protein